MKHLIAALLVTALVCVISPRSHADEGLGLKQLGDLYELLCTLLGAEYTPVADHQLWSGQQWKCHIEVPRATEKTG